MRCRRISHKDIVRHFLPLSMGEGGPPLATYPLPPLCKGRWVSKANPEGLTGGCRGNPSVVKDDSSPCTGEPYQPSQSAALTALPKGEPRALFLKRVACRRHDGCLASSLTAAQKRSSERCCQTSVALQAPAPFKRSLGYGGRFVNRPYNIPPLC